jgi:hypothetical protein
MHDTDEKGGAVIYTIICSKQWLISIGSLNPDNEIRNIKANSRYTYT